MSTNQPWSFASPWGGGLVHAEVVNINSADNSVQIRIHGYQDDKGNIPDDKLEWVKVLGQHSGIMGATATHPYYVGSRVMVGTSGPEKFIVGSVTGYDSDQTKSNDGADNSDNKDPNTPRQVRGTKGPGNRDIPAGEGSDQTSKGTRSVNKTDKQYDEEKPQKVYDYAKQQAPFDKGKQSKFPDLKSIGIDLLSQGSNVLDTVEKLDGNVSGAIKSSIQIIRNMERGGFGDALSLMGGAGGAADQGTAQVADYHGNMQLGELLAALLALLAAAKLVQGVSTNSMSSDMTPVPEALVYATFGVDPILLQSIQVDVVSLDTSVGGAKQGVVDRLKADFATAFHQAIANAVAYVSSLVDQAGTAAILVAGMTDIDSLNQLIASLQSGAAAAGLPPSAVPSIGGGQVGQIIQQGQTAIRNIMQQGQQALGQLQKMMGDMNTFAPELNAMSEILGGGASIQESLTNITMKFVRKRINLDGRGFTK
jgi:hypothetical protein